LTAMSKSWEDLKRDRGFRSKVENTKDYQEVVYRESSQLDESALCQDLLSYIQKIDLHIASLREGIMVLEERLAALEKKLKDK